MREPRVPHFGPDSGLRFTIVAWVVWLSCLGLSFPAAAATFCVASSQDLQAALQIADGNSSSDDIRILAGTYVAPTPAGFQFLGPNEESDEGVTLSGGWFFDCTRFSGRANLTVLSGGGVSPVLFFSTDTGVTVRLLTIESASSAGNAALHVTQTSDILNQGATIIDRVIFHHNEGLAALYSNRNGFLSVEGSLFYANLVTDPNGAGAILHPGSIASSRIANNTFAFNLADNAVAPAGLLLANGDAVFPEDAHIINNIFWGNENFDVKAVNEEATFNYNNYGVAFGGLIGFSNTQLDPSFVAPQAFDYRLRNDSPVLDNGTNTGNLPDFDIAGTARPQNGTYDRGAYEFPTIFSDGFESGNTALWHDTVP